MRLSEDAKKLPGVADAVIAMGTDTNKELLRQMNLLNVQGQAASADDMILAVTVSRAASLPQATKAIEDLVAGSAGLSRSQAPRFFTVEAALERHPEMNFAVVSVPGHLAPEVTMDLMRRGLHVQLFSDHVSVREEVSMKNYASRHGLLLLGPGAGTSIINGTAIAFANVVRRGDVGVVAAAGTGLQEVSVLLDRVGLGISQALGVGGTDMSEEVGGRMTIDALRALEEDDLTRMIVIIAKTSTTRVMARVLRVISREISKPLAACFLGGIATRQIQGRGRLFWQARTLHAAVAQVSRASGHRYERAFRSRLSMTFRDLEKYSLREGRRLNRKQRYLRGIYTGGTLAHEAQLIYRETIGEAFSNTPLTPRFKLRNTNESVGNCVVDLGDESFTGGRVHPMIDPTFRRLRVAQEAKDPAVAAILQDFVLGFGSNDDPAGGMLAVIAESTEAARKDGRHIVFMGHVCGTSNDPQSLEKEERKLSQAGVMLFPTNALMAIGSALLVARSKEQVENIRAKYEYLLGVD